MVFFHQYLFPLAIGDWIGAPLGGLALLGFAKMISCQQSIFSVKSLSHYFGSKVADPCISAGDNIFIALIAAGEGNHNYHHAFIGDFEPEESGIPWIAENG